MRSIATPKTTLTADNDKITLKWVALAGATEYRVYSTNKYALLTTANQSTLTYTHSNLTYDTQYTYLVLGYNGISESSYTSANNISAKLTKSLYPQQRQAIGQ